MFAEIVFHPQEECFTHRDDDGTFRTFVTGSMARFAAEYGGRCDQVIAAKLPIQQHVIAHIREKMGIEQPRLDRLRDPYLHIPVIAIEWNSDPIITFVDGNHRLCKLDELGETSFKCYIFKAGFWENFLLPISRGEEALSIPSRMIEFEQGKLS